MSTQFFVLNLDGWFGMLSNKFLFFDIFDILYYYINHRSSIVFCLSSGDISFIRYFFIMFVCNCFWIILSWTFWDFRSSISNFVTSQIFSCFCLFLNECFWRSFESVADCLPWSRSFWLYLQLPIFLSIFLLTIFAKRQKPTAFYKYSISRLNRILHRF